MSNLYGPINPELHDSVSETYRRVILFDPTPVYQRWKVNPYKRFQQVPMEKVFVNANPMICACGCGKPLTGRQTRWAGEDCRNFAFMVWAVITGRAQTIKYIVNQYTDYRCAYCGREQYDNNGYDGIHLDHIVGVKQGGGGCWLGNYQFLCHSCNIQKSAIERRLKEKPGIIPISTLFNM